MPKEEVQSPQGLKLNLEDLYTLRSDLSSLFVRHNAQNDLSYRVCWTEIFPKWVNKIASITQIKVMAGTNEQVKILIFPNIQIEMHVELDAYKIYINILKL